MCGLESAAALREATDVSAVPGRRQPNQGNRAEAQTGSSQGWPFQYSGLCCGEYRVGRKAKGSKHL